MKTTLLVFFASLALPVVASADIPPPPNYVEQCTVKKQCGATEVGATCSTYHEAPDKCKELYSASAFTYKCRTRGASTWTEVWCAPKGTVDPGLPQPAPAKPATP